MFTNHQSIYTLCTIHFRHASGARVQTWLANVRKFVYERALFALGNTTCTLQYQRARTREACVFCGSVARFTSGMALFA